MRLAILFLALVVQTTRADEIKDFVDFQQVKLRTYNEAVEIYNKDKQPVIIWVKPTDDLYDSWLQTKDLGTHVFVQEFPHTNQGIVVGGERNKQFVVLANLKYGPTNVAQIKKAVVTTTPPPLCPDGKCPIPQRK